ncbi:MAG: DNA cytosine methyltransferase [Firmicutes bacterium]|nr:DNA cytosine methyltransferase [Bacillota bacterium]
MKNKIIDLFAGAGGLSEGFRRNNFDIVAHVEMDKDASYTLKTREAYYYCKENNKMDLYLNYLNKKITRDEFYNNIPQNILNKVINKEISDSTINEIFSSIDKILDGDSIKGIIGGPPCQAYSIAGRSRKKDMSNDPRNYLYLYYLMFIKKYKPDFFVFENVQGILSAKGGTIFQDIQKQMKKIGYTIDYKLLNSNDFGVVQHRKRIIIIGYKKELNKTYPEFETFSKKYNIQDLFDDLPKISAGACNNNYQKKSNQCLKDLKIRNNDWNTLTYNESRKLNENDKNIYKICIEQKNVKYDDLPQHLIKHNNTKCFLDRFKVVAYDKPSHTMVAHISKDGHHYIHPDIKQLRSLTVREAARIQSFPDDYYFESSKTSAFKQIGNAVPVFMADIIAKKIEESLN